MTNIILYLKVKEYTQICKNIKGRAKLYRNIWVLLSYPEFYSHSLCTCALFTLHLYHQD